MKCELTDDELTEALDDIEQGEYEAIYAIYALNHSENDSEKREARQRIKDANAKIACAKRAIERGKK